MLRQELVKVSTNYIETVSENTRNKINVSDDAFSLIVFVCLLINFLVGLGMNPGSLAC